ncbi:hypothetical protein NS365_15135, partial [Aureimonas ureilytica]
MAISDGSGKIADRRNAFVAQTARRPARRWTCAPPPAKTPGMIALPTLPVSAVLPDVSRALAAHGSAVLVAPPGAGKTTLVPLHLLNDLPEGRILLVEPRRIAARAAA